MLVIRVLLPPNHNTVSKMPQDDTSTIQSDQISTKESLAQTPSQPSTTARPVVVHIRGPTNIHHLATVDFVASLQVYAPDDTDDSLARKPEGSHTAFTLIDMQKSFNGRFPLLSKWAAEGYWLGKASKKPCEDDGYQEWEKPAYVELKEGVSRFEQEKEKKTVGITVVEDDESLAQLERDGYRQMLFCDFERNSKAPSTQASTNQ
jgi:hypothetical protein